MSGTALWELNGVGHIDRRIVGDSAAIRQRTKFTGVIGAWAQFELADVIVGLLQTGFELHSVRRLDLADRPD